MGTFKNSYRFGKFERDPDTGKLKRLPGETSEDRKRQIREQKERRKAVQKKALAESLKKLQQEP